MATRNITINGKAIALPIPTRTLTVFDASDKILATAQGKNTSLRFSVRGAADQRQLDALCALHPTATRATIGTVEFVVRNGKTAMIGL